MDLLLCRSVWGLEPEPDRWPDRLPAVAARGYAAVGLPVQQVPDAAPLRDALASTGLALVAQVFTFGRTLDAHLSVLEEGLAAAAALGARHAVVQGGRDGWELEDGVRFLRQAAAVAERVGVPALHETHRSRLLFSPWATERLLTEVPDVAVAVDLSHWTCVGETMRIPERVLRLVASRTGHVDARVGWEQGPQVADPRLPASSGYVETFEGWWDLLWEVQAAAGAPELVVQPEFGPPPYQPVHPGTGEPLADVNELNDWMAGRLRERYGRPRLPPPSTGW